jgi:hypothetical protein
VSRLSPSLAVLQGLASSADGIRQDRLVLEKMRKEKIHAGEILAGIREYHDSRGFCGVRHYGEGRRFVFVSL